MKTKRICPQCNATFYVSKSRLNHGRGKHCSPECQYKSRKGSKMTAKQIENISNTKSLYYKKHPEARLAVGKRFKGFKHSNASRKKMSDSHKGIPSNRKGKPNQCIKGNKHPNWRGGRIKHANGYIWIYSPNHPTVIEKKRKYVLEHRLAMEKHLGRFLTKEERIHHINGIKSDNCLINLMLFISESAHQKYHNK